MRKLILTKIIWQTGENTFEDYRLVVVNHKPGESEEDLLHKANDQVLAWFPTEYPESQYKGIISKATIGEPSEPLISKEGTESPFKHAGWNDNSTQPEGGTEGYTEDVLIDIDGNRNTFRVGYYDHDAKKWFLYVNDDTIDVENMRWARLPFKTKEEIDAEDSGS